MEGKMLSRTSALGSAGWISTQKKKLQQEGARFQSIIPAFLCHSSKKFVLEGNVLQSKHLILVHEKYKIIILFLACPSCM